MARDPLLCPALRTVAVIDPDRLEERTVPLSRLYSTALKEQGPDLLRSLKAEVVASHLRAYYPARSGHLLWAAYPVEVADVSWQHLRSLDVLISCTDNALARLETTFVARCLGLPLLDGGVFGEGVEGGRVSYFSAHSDAACYLCGLSEERRAELLTEASAVSLPCAVSPETCLGRNPVVSASLQHTAGLLTEQIRHFVDESRTRGKTPLKARSWAVRLQPDAAGQWGRNVVGLRRSVSCPWHSGMRLPLLSVEPWTRCDLGLRRGCSSRGRFACSLFAGAAAQRMSGHGGWPWSEGGVYVSTAARLTNLSHCAPWPAWGKTMLWRTVRRGS